MKLRLVLVVLFLVLQAFIVSAVSYKEGGGADLGLDAIAKIPHSFAGWSGTDYPLDPSVYDILETRAIIHRLYENRNGERVFLSIVYYAQTKVDFHAPEACLGGQGVKTSKSEDSVFIADENMKLKVNRLIQDDGGSRQDLVYYFFKSGPFAGSSYFSLRLNLIFNKFSKRNNSGSLIRVSTSMKDGNSNSKFILGKFINDVKPYIDNSL